MPKTIPKLLHILFDLLHVADHLDTVKINQGRLLAAINRDEEFNELHKYEFKVFSQWGEDGIIQFLTSNLTIKNKTFIEFGVEDFFESNCRFLMMKDHWQGFVIDGSRNNIDRLKASSFYWKHQINARQAFITKENIQSLLEESRFDKDIGLLSIDIDGVDYFVLEQLIHWRPSILIVEYNGIFGAEKPVSVPYSSDFVRSKQHYSHLYYGASLPAFQYLASQRGYALVGVNGVGSNAFFVRKELLNNRVKEVTLESCFRPSTFRECRAENGALTFLSGVERRLPIATLPLVDVGTGASMTVADLGNKG
jgi:hypothetical protein